jgi:hypothetical protein
MFLTMLEGVLGVLAVVAGVLFTVGQITAALRAYRSGRK